MTWCEANRVDYLFGLARTVRLVEEIAQELAAAARESAITGASARRFKDFPWTTRDSWSRRRRVVGKAEHTQGEANPRFVVTSLSQQRADARALYEDLYCARGEMENRIKECQLDLFADRTSTATMRANQLRLWFAVTTACARAARRHRGAVGRRRRPYDRALPGIASRLVIDLADLWNNSFSSPFSNTTLGYTTSGTLSGSYAGGLNTHSLVVALNWRF